MDPVTLGAIVVMMVFGAALSGSAPALDSDLLLFGALVVAAVVAVVALSAGR